MIESDSYYFWNRTDKKFIFVDSKENPIDSLESILLFLKREDNLKWKWIIFALHHSLYQFCIANLEGGNYDRVLTSVNEPDKNLYFKRGNEKWKKSKIIKSNNPPLYRIGWETIDGEPEKRKIKVSIRKRLLGFWSVIARIQDPKLFMGRSTNSNAIILSDEEEKSIVNLVNLRNKLMHFIPTMWSIEIEYCKQILFNILNVIERIVFDTHQIIFVEEEDQERIKKAIQDIKSFEEN